MSDLIERQAAIVALCKAGCDSGYCGASCDDVKAIENLPSVQPTQNNTPNALKPLDCIDRQAAIDALEKIDCSDGVGLSALKCDAVDDAVVTIKALPSAQQERTKVKWIKKMKVTETDTYTSYDPEWYCPQCGTKYDPYFAQKVNFCCVCGSDMRGEQG